jgi:hypothetical protein
LYKNYIIFIYDDSYLFFFQGYYENSKGHMRGKPIHASRDVQKSVEEDGKINEHNFIARGAIPTTICIIDM